MFIRSKSGEVGINSTAVDSIGVLEGKGEYKVIIYPKNASPLSIPDIDLSITDDKKGFVESTHETLESARERLDHLRSEGSKTVMKEGIAGYRKARKH